MTDFKGVISDLSADLQKIDEIILSFASGKSPLIGEISDHLISSGGKRIRPILLILSAKLCGYNSGQGHYDLAAAVELIHSATLLHDDVVDESLVRRGKKTANALWDNKASILVGDYLFSTAFRLMVRVGNLPVLDLLSKASSIMADGEVMQLENSSEISLTKEKYLEIIDGKTAVLFEASCQAGALICNKSEKEILALKEFGNNLGVIFQIVDDLLDYSSKDDVLGKEVGNDFFEGKVTLPVILTLQGADAADKKTISDLFMKNLTQNDKDKGDFEIMLNLMKKYNAFELSKDLALEHQRAALDNLQIFEDSKAKEDLKIILDYSSSRIF